MVRRLPHSCTGGIHGRRDEENRIRRERYRSASWIPQTVIRRRSRERAARRRPDSEERRGDAENGRLGEVATTAADSKETARLDDANLSEAIYDGATRWPTEGVAPFDAIARGARPVE